MRTRERVVVCAGGSRGVLLSSETEMPLDWTARSGCSSHPPKGQQTYEERQQRLGSGTQPAHNAAFCRRPRRAAACRHLSDVWGLFCASVGQNNPNLRNTRKNLSRREQKCCCSSRFGLPRVQQSASNMNVVPKTAPDRAHELVLWQFFVVVGEFGTKKDFKSRDEQASRETGPR